MDLIRAVYEQHETRWPGAGLSCVKKLDSSPAGPCRGMFFNDFFYGLIDCGSTYSLRELLKDQVDPVKEIHDPLTRQRGEVDPWGK